ncbi:MAG: D-alanine--D-alanine ligase [Pseudomonadota bacterium]
MKKSVGILHADISDNADEDEKDVLIQLEAVSNALAHLGFDPVSVKFGLNLENAVNLLQKLKPSFVFNLVESVNGCGSLIHLAPSLLDYLKIPYTGSKTQAMFLTSNKLLGKGYLEAHGISTPKAYCLSSLKRETTVNGRYIIKSVWEHASIGMEQDSVVDVKSISELVSRLESVKTNMGGEFFCEQYIDGREFNIALLSGPNGVEVLPPAEILFTDYPEDKHKIVDYSAKWQTDSFEYINTKRTFNFRSDDMNLIESLKIISKQCWDLFELKGYARVDFRVDESGMPWVLEINANPCISPDSGFAAASKMIGLDFTDVIKRIIEDI